LRTEALDPVKEPVYSVSLVLAEAKASLKAPDIDLACLFLTLFNDSMNQSRLAVFQSTTPSIHYISEDILYQNLAKISPFVLKSPLVYPAGTANTANSTFFTTRLITIKIIFKIRFGKRQQVFFIHFKCL